MRSIAFVVAACCTLGCDMSDVMTRTTTAPTPALATAAAPRAVFALELTAPLSPDFATGSAVIGVRTRDSSGAVTDADVACSTSAGVLMPARFNTRHVPAIELARAQVRTRVQCASADINTSIEVDMSAWGIDLGENSYVGFGERAGESRVLLLPRQRIAGVPATGLTLNWGDGAIESSPFVPVSLPATLFHRYRAAGLYTATARVEWPGGAYERRFTVVGGPPGSKP